MINLLKLDIDSLQAWLAANGLTLSFAVRRYQSETAHCEETCETPVTSFSGESGLAGYSISWEWSLRETFETGGFRGCITARVEEAGEVPISIGLRLAVADWRRDDYVVLPSAVYAGNRFRARKMKYPPHACDPEDFGLDAEPLISDVPRLERVGDSMVQQKSGDLSTPAIGVRRGQGQLGLWWLGPQRTAWGECVYEVAETFADGTGSEAGRADLGIWCPGVRHDTRYEHCSMDYPSEDRGITPKAGDSITLEFALHGFDCPDVPALFDRFRMIRKTIEPPSDPRFEMPVSEAYRLVSEKTIRDNWVEYDGMAYIGVGASDAHPVTWQPGWVGGLQNTLPLLRTGNEEVIAKVKATMDFATGPGQAESGLFYGKHGRDGFNGDHFGKKDNWHLTRKSADTLYFLMKHLAVWRDRFGEPEQAWLDAAERCAEAFVTLWNRHGQFGQFVDHASLDMIVAHSGSASVAPAGLAMAAQVFDRPAYLEVARAAARQQDQRYVTHGYTTGGPGEACQCPDSESCFAYLESAIVLYESTGEAEWLDLARRAADLAASWCLSYDYTFPSSSEFGKHAIPSVGGVFANVQNKHAAPGICTFSGDSLLKLYRATGERDYLDLLADITRCMPWCVSRPGRQIRASNGKLQPAGWINERLNTSDWDHNVGGVFYGDCWCETAFMLAATEVPGVYIDHARKVIACLDHLRLKDVAWEADAVCFRLINSTAYDAEVFVLTENVKHLIHKLGCNASRDFETVDLPAGASIDLCFVSRDREQNRAVIFHQ